MHFAYSHMGRERVDQIDGCQPFEIRVKPLPGIFSKSLCTDLKYLETRQSLSLLT